MLKEILSLSIVKKIKSLDYEVSMFIYLDENGNFHSAPNTERVGNAEDVSIAYIYEVVTNCRNLGCNKVILLHNHPVLAPRTGIGFIDWFLSWFSSSKVTPSKGDLITTGGIIGDLKKEGITVIDHIIIGKGGYFSFKNNDML